MYREELSIEEAKERCKQYQFLCGSSLLINDHIDTVTDVLPAPYHARDQWVFYHCFQQSKSLITALSFYKQDDFDVIVIIKECYPDGMVDYSYMTLENYLDLRDVDSFKSRYLVTN